MQFTAVFQKVAEGYIGFIEELPGANTQGATLDEARENSPRQSNSFSKQTEPSQKSPFRAGRSFALDDPAGLFNASLDGKVRRAIDIHEGETPDARAIKALIKAAVAANTSSAKSKPARK